MKSIDWKNHIVSFLSALIGIIIAFQLDDLRESNEQEEQLDTAYNLVIEEIESNIDIYKKNVSSIGAWLTYYDIFGRRKVEQLKLSLDVYLEIIEDSSRANRLSYFDIVINNDTAIVVGNQYNRVENNLRIDVYPQTGISTNAWEAGKFSGIFSQLPPKKLNKLTKIYSWTSNDLGQNENAFFEYGVNTQDRKFDNIDTLVRNYKVIYEVQKFKLDKISPLYQELLDLEF